MDLGSLRALGALCGEKFGLGSAASPIGPTHGSQPGAEAGRQALEGREIVLRSVPEKWRKLALFFGCPNRRFSALQTPRQIGTLQSAVCCVHGVWLADDAEPGAIFHRGATSELRVARSALARGETAGSVSMNSFALPRSLDFRGQQRAAERPSGSVFITKRARVKIGLLRQSTSMARAGRPGWSGSRGVR